MTKAHLASRAFLKIGGVDAESFLQNLITTDLSGLQPGETAPGALLSPQGKILFAFLIGRDGDGFCLESDSGSQDNLLKRLTLYRLRAKVELEPLPFDGVRLCWDEAAAEGLLDRRFLRAGKRLLRQPIHGHPALDEVAYRALRIACGIPEAAEDFALGDAFPHDVMMDLTGGLSFRKGCYVGQEVVSRMQHRATARRRIVQVFAEDRLPPPATALTASGKSIGTLGTVEGQSGLALVRIDKAGAAMAAGEPVLAGLTPVRLVLPEWSGLSFPTDAEAEDRA